MLIFLYACESWTLNADTERRIRAMEMRYYRRLLGISHKEHIANEEVRRRNENDFELHMDPLTIGNGNSMGRLFAHLALPKPSCRVL
ncbi:RNA-directed DNA polymerase from mobile element jockey [Elysia marginata]|uniref:RNA-directed DNA polymerase from mobile element jockey n=1 Tax=Elysia marginata TaxID=1093978 RepID=A0AAV4HUP1_9GAST|nr:RNA-directed DNA polymerase from mobile element jockey [Elysia marginata]